MKKQIKWAGILGIGSLLALSFQNCGGDLTPLNQAIEGQSLYDSQAALDNSALPGLLGSSDLVWWQTNGVNSVAKSPVFADSSSVVLALDSSIQGTVYTFNSGSSSEEARVSVTSGKVRIWHITDGSNYAYGEADLPAGEEVLVAASFGTEATDLTLLVNGWKQELSIQKMGTPLAYSYLLKSIATGGSGGSVLDAVVYATALSGAELNVMSRYAAKEVGVQNVAFDPSLVNDGGGTTVKVPTAQFLAAKSIIDANCIGCHNNSNNGDFRNLTQDQFIQKGLVVADNPAGSKIYYRLNGATSGPGPATMPQGGALSAAQVQVIADWINSIN